MRPKVILSVLVSLALLLTFGMAVKDAKADAIMFPWVIKSDNVSTIISVVNTAALDLIHFQYWHKINYPHIDDVNHQENWCEEFNFKATVSKDDLVSFDSSGKINDGLPLWNDDSNQTLFVDSFALAVDGSVRAYLLVDNNTAGTSLDGTLYGEAMVVELTTGAVWGYIAYNSMAGEASSQDSPVYFEDGRDLLGEVIGVDETTQTIILNPNAVITKFFVTPITYGSARSPNSNARVQLCTRPDQHGDCKSGGMFNNIEGALSFTNRKEIVCTTADKLEEFISTAAFVSFRDSGRSGWSYIVTHPGTLDVNPFDLNPDNPTGDVCIGKLEYTEDALEIDGMTIPITPGVSGGTNNFIWLRDSETSSIAGAQGINYIHNVYSQMNPMDAN